MTGQQSDKLRKGIYDLMIPFFIKARSGNLSSDECCVQASDEVVRAIVATFSGQKKDKDPYLLM